MVKLLSFISFLCVLLSNDSKGQGEDDFSSSDNTITSHSNEILSPSSSSSYYQKETVMGSVEDRLSSLEKQINELRGKVEKLQHTLANASSSVPVLPPIINPQREANEDPLSLQEKDPTSTEMRSALKLYENAQEYLAQQAYPEAERLLKELIANYPLDPLALNAKYWLGEVYFIEKNYKKAAIAFGDFYQTYRTLDQKKQNEKINFAQKRAREILVKLALSLKALGKNEQACLTLDKLHSEFPILPENIKELAEKVKQGLTCQKENKG